MRRVGRRQSIGDVAVKVVRKVNCRKIEVVHALSREIKILNLLDHPNIVSMVDLWHELSLIHI